MLAPSSRRVLGFVAGLCGLNDQQTKQVAGVAWFLADKHPNAEDDIVQEMALRAWTNNLFRRGTNTGDLIAAANRAVAERR